MHMHKTGPREPLVIRKNKDVMNNTHLKIKSQIFFVLKVSNKKVDRTSGKILYPNKNVLSICILLIAKVRPSHTKPKKVHIL